jgi:hypothetical protein
MSLSCETKFVCQLNRSCLGPADAIPVQAGRFQAVKGAEAEHAEEVATFREVVAAAREQAGHVIVAKVDQLRTLMEEDLAMPDAFAGVSALQERSKGSLLLKIDGAFEGCGARNQLLRWERIQRKGRRRGGGRARPMQGRIEGQKETIESLRRDSANYPSVWPSSRGGRHKSRRWVRG